jgi:hypothetical protein
MLMVSLTVDVISKNIGKNFSSPDEVRKFEKGKIEIVNFPESGITIGRGTLDQVGVGKNVSSLLLILPSFTHSICYLWKN